MTCPFPKMSDLSQQLIRSNRLPANADFLHKFLAAAVDANTKNNSNCLLPMMVFTQAQSGLKIMGVGADFCVICCFSPVEKQNYRKTVRKMSGNKQCHESLYPFLLRCKIKVGPTINKPSKTNNCQAARKNDCNTSTPLTDGFHSLPKFLPLSPIF